MEDNRSEMGWKKPSNASHSQKKVINNQRLSNLLKLGTLGLDLEELSVGIERKYEEMLVILRNNI